MMLYVIYHDKNTTQLNNYSPKQRQSNVQKRDSLVNFMNDMK